MHKSWWGLVVWAGCAPPPEVDLGAAGDPSIEILYPSSLDEDVRVEDDGVLRLTIVVDIDGFEFLPAYAEEPNVVDREGQGHWHLVINGATKRAAEELFVEYESDPDEFAPDDLLVIQAQLVSNTHNPLAIDGQVIDTVEITVAP